MRIQPYRTIDNFILGAVITFVDITEAVRTRLALKKANSLLRLAVVVRDAFDAVTMNDLEGRTLAWNPAATTLYGWTEPEALRLNFRERVPPALQTGAMADLRRLAQAEVQEAQRTQRLAKDGRYVAVWVKATAVENDDGQIYAIATTERPAPSAAEEG